MMNTCGGKSRFQWPDPSLNHEYQTVKTYFDIQRRATPSPFIPAKEDCFHESGMMDHLKTNRQSAVGLSLYVHIPFCDGKCAFCDLYCFHLPPNRREVLEDYVKSLETEILRWGALTGPHDVPVTTVHFGGGSPLILAPEQLERILAILRDNFTITPKTELAVEVTTSQITRFNLRLFERLSITRIHAGIQTLADSCRRIIGRREPAAVAINKLKTLCSGSFVVSVDLLYGLPLQTGEVFRDDLERLMEIGVDGFALYELQLSAAMRKIIAQTPAYRVDKLQSYRMLLEGNHFLRHMGFRQVFFNHYGNQRDQNLYFTYPGRGEDCLAFGTIADGQLGNLFFRHGKYRPYLESIGNGGLGIDFGYRESKLRTRNRLFETELLSGRLTGDSLTKMEDLFGLSFKGILDLWKAAGLLVPAEIPGDYRLTGSGCWFIAGMIDQIRRLG